MARYFKPLDRLIANRARVEMLDKEIPKLKNLAKKLENDISIRTTRYGDDTAFIHPEGNHSDPTQVKALEVLPDDVRQLYDDIRALTIERQRTNTWITVAETALGFLNERQRIIVTLRHVEHMSWEEVADAFFEQTGEILSVTSCRNNFFRACDKIEPFFSAGIVDCNSVSESKKRAYYASST